MKPQNSQSKTQTVDATSVEVVPAFISNLYSYNMQRTQIIITNAGATVITLKKGSSLAVVGEGIILQPAASYLESTDGGYTCWQGAFNAIGDGAGGMLSITESWVQD